MPKIKDLRIKATPEQVMQAIMRGGGMKKPKEGAPAGRDSRDRLPLDR